MFGAQAETAAEVVFNTGLTGYQEICTDPSYRGQMVVMTHPQIGNYGISDRVRESDQPWLAALIVRDAAPEPHHWASRATIDEYLTEFGVPGLAEVDTRAITRRLRTKGTLRGVLTQVPARRLLDDHVREALVERARQHTLPVLLGQVSGHTPALASNGDGPNIAVVDCGVKWSIVQQLEQRGAHVGDPRHLGDGALHRGPRERRGPRGQPGQGVGVTEHARSVPPSDPSAGDPATRACRCGQGFQAISTATATSSRETTPEPAAMRP
jgi:carbamoylphosphate synthase small subunit